MSARIDHTRWPSAGRVLAVVTVLPVLLLAAWLLAGVPLLLLGWFRPLPTVLLAAAVLCGLAAVALRRLPEWVDATAGQALGVVGVAAASGVFNALFHTEQLAVRRDPATYAQYTVWVAEHGSLPIPAHLGAFGGPDPALEFVTIGFYGMDGAIVPQFMPGAPIVYAAGHWLGGAIGMLLTPPAIGALAVLTVAGLAARLVGAAWAPLAAAVFAVCMPILYTSRTTFSEIPSLILLLGALALLLDAHARTIHAGTAHAGTAHARTTAAGTAPASRPLTRARLGAALAGLIFGLAVSVRIDGLRDLLPVLVFAGLLIALRRMRRAAPALAGTEPGRLQRGLMAGWPEFGWPLLGGLAVGLALLSGPAAYVLSRPYLEYLSGALVPLLAICAAVLVLTAAGALAGPYLARPYITGRRRLPRRLPDMAAVAVALLMAAFAVRPFVSTVRRVPTNPADALNAGFISQVQENNGLAVDPTRLYYEDSLYWVFWYIGVPTVAFATIAAALLVRRMLRGGEAAWLLPLAVIGWTTVTTLIRPDITPDHPWAARRLVPVVLPGLIVLGVWGLRWAKEKARRKGYGSRPQTYVAAVGALLMLVPTAVTSIGTAFTPIERGELAAVEGLCRRIPPDASVLIVDRATADRFTQVVRGMCGVPTAKVDLPPDPVAASADLGRLLDRIRSAGRRPVLLGAEERQVQPYGTAHKVLDLKTRQDERSLVDPPNATWSFSMTVWMSTP
ncbi:hypothetical protein SAMN05421505_106133 [Sinosporangium album]|uniref:Dolichyl-phosphate-mannose-protein mannosyltransferase n=1 Tax=Sinosporangium album TaxID=504805 RepID=A0A1G7VZS1_9ACTN|nr:hypothetical protein [Sinosporangium album]SDG65274.1 hypothetical protein SAMN05421505_106133 [Sinosporangium album]